MNKQIKSGNRTAVIYSNTETGPFYARLYVNGSSKSLGDATLIARKFKSLKGAEKFAAKVTA